MSNSYASLEKLYGKIGLPDDAAAIIFALSTTEFDQSLRDEVAHFSLGERGEASFKEMRNKLEDAFEEINGISLSDQATFIRTSGDTIRYNAAIEALLEKDQMERFFGSDGPKVTLEAIEIERDTLRAKLEKLDRRRDEVAAMIQTYGPLDNETD